MGDRPDEKLLATANIICYIIFVPPNFSPKERQLINLAASGKYSGPTALAQALNSEPNTVRTHFQRIYFKLFPEGGSFTKLVLWAREHSQENFQ